MQQASTLLQRLSLHTSVLFFLKWATLRIERGAKERNHPLYKPYSNGNASRCFSPLWAPSATIVALVHLLIVCCSYHCQGRHLFGGGDQGDPAEREQQRPGLAPWVWDVRHLLFCSARSGEHHGRRGDQALHSRGAGDLESVNPQQQQLPVHQPEVDGPVGAGRGHPLWLPAASQVSAALSKVLLVPPLVKFEFTCFDIRESTQLDSQVDCLPALNGMACHGLEEDLLI